MKGWMEYSVEIVAKRDRQTLTSSFLDSISQRLALETAFVLTPNAEGRTLSSSGLTPQLVWSVNDFNVPFSHVINKSEVKVLTSDELIYWQNDVQFSQLAQKVGMFSSMAIYPLPLKENKVANLLVMVGDNDKLHALSADQAFLQYLDLFSNQFALLDEMASSKLNQQILSDSLQHAETRCERQKLQNDMAKTLVGTSVAMQRLREKIVSAASSHLAVMVQGETGTGKELVAQAIHQASSRSSQAMIAINCAAIPENLLESELFGYCKGAFSGADSDRKGLIAQADGGTLFLDEIGDMPLGLQAKLLRVLETKQFRPLGGKEEQYSDFRLVCATHVNLIQQVREKQFRQDLYYRLCQFPLAIPTLSQRIEDIDELAHGFIKQYNREHDASISGIDSLAIDRLKQYAFPGNVRELKHLIEFGCAQTLQGKQISLNSVKDRLHVLSNLGEPTHIAVPSIEPLHTSSNEIEAIDDLKHAIRCYEASIIQSRLDKYRGDRAKAARSLGIPKRTLAYKCQKLELIG
ncbi:sigma-54 interaction domain-containing protein [Vibrio sp. LaRot3]|uniref:sigma-54 interaction domain-containing protein n=1 Tax=Vibrio sp. LaRot3 TaxID=2998829 RepID=UPI0022CDE535|nr:sigma-54 dependent transcriptional regulator [Vibrio sp. LaRot3]MDA0148879.1 sigma-54 dependent transcriptional regulator [Vibrio sp. LaRot3]